MWRGAAACDLSKGDLVGHAVVTQAPNDKLLITITTVNGICMDKDASAWAGDDYLPKNDRDKYVSIPGQLPCQKTIDLMTCTVVAFECTPLDLLLIYIAIHIDACGISDPVS